MPPPTVFANFVCSSLIYYRVFRHLSTLYIIFLNFVYIYKETFLYIVCDNIFRIIISDFEMTL